MRKLTTLLLCSLFWLSASIAFAGSNIMKIHDVTAIPGDNITVSIEVINEDQFVAFQVDIPFPAGFGYVAGSFALTARSNGHIANANILPGTNVFRALAFSLTNSPFNGNSGIVATFSLTTPAVAGTHVLVPTNAIISNPQGAQILTGTVNGTITLTTGTTIVPGDANCDGNVNAIDIITLVNYIMGFNPQPFCFENADVNNDGSVNAIDVIGTVNIIMGGGGFTCGNPFTDSRDGQSYNTVLIGTQCWMAENLKYLPEVVGPGTGSNNVPYYYVYGYNGTSVSAAKATANYQTYGALYNWPASLTACPSGWHLPTDAEWTALTTYVSSQPAYLCNSNTSYIAKSLAATTNWYTHTGTCTVGNNLSANNATGFSGLPGGYRVTDGTFDGIGYYGLWWSSTEYDASIAWGRIVYYNYAGVYRNDDTKGYGFSARCVRD